MKRKTQKLFVRMEVERIELMKACKSLSSKQLRFKPGVDEWNILQVLRHIITAEKQSLILIQKRLDRKESVPKSGAGAAFRYFLLKTALILPLKYKAPKFVDVSEDYPDFDSMISEWTETRRDLNQIIESNDDQTLAKALYRHPRAGMLNVLQALRFMTTHISHHQKQIARIKKHPSFPNSD
ncbi:MAG: DinB family protein [Balneolales bacterium]|nr:DinB family protein [Balneolales bacterium]